MRKWLVTVTRRLHIPEDVIDAVDDARDQALHLGVERLGVAEILDNGNVFYVIRKEDFREWFGE